MFTGRHSSYYGDWYDCPIFQLFGKLLDAQSSLQFCEGQSILRNDQTLTALLRVIPLGGLGEIGKNMMALEYQDDIVIVGCGVQFPEEGMFGVDLIIPDISYLMERQDKVRAILITHGHEDHIGALPFVLPQLRCPVYAPRLAHGLITAKLK